MCVTPLRTAAGMSYRYRCHAGSETLFEHVATAGRPALCAAGLPALLEFRALRVALRHLARSVGRKEAARRGASDLVVETNAGKQQRCSCSRSWHMSAIKKTYDF